MSSTCGSIPRTTSCACGEGPGSCVWLPEAVDALFRSSAGLQPQLRSDHEWYLEIDVENQFPGSAVVSCEPEALVFLERHQDAATQLQPLDVDSALKRLMKDIYVSEPSVIERHRQTLARLLQTKAYTLSYSGDPAEGRGSDSIHSA